MTKTKIWKISFFSIVYFTAFSFNAAASAQNNVSIVDYSYNPSNIQINVGDAVIWTNNGQMQHTVTSNTGNELNSSSLNNGNTYSHTFTTAGTFAYHCAFHPYMHGSVTIVSSSSNLNVQTNPATNVSNNQATLNGYFSGANSYNTYVWFQYGINTNYGSQTQQQILNNSGSFNQNIANLSYNTIYHFRAVAEGNSGNVYGQDMIFNSNGSTSYTNGHFSITKQVINLTGGNLSWASSVNANPSDILSFAITIQPGNQDIHNVFIRDILPSNLNYLDRLTVNTNSNYGGSIISGINIGTIYANQPIVVAYQVQVAPYSNFSFGDTTLTNNATITSSESGTEAASAQVVVNNQLVYGATTVSTGITNNPIKDSFLLPVLLIILLSYLYFSGKIYIFSDWLGNKNKLEK